MDTVKKMACKTLMEEFQLLPENAQMWYEAIFVKPQMVKIVDMQKIAMKIMLKDILKIVDGFQCGPLDGVCAARDFFWKLLGLEKNMPELMRMDADRIAEYGEFVMAFRHSLRDDGTLADSQLCYAPEILGGKCVGDVICITAHEAWHGWQSAQVSELIIDVEHGLRNLSVNPNECDRRMLYFISNFLEQKDRRIYKDSYSTNLSEREAELFLRLVMMRICSFSLDNKVSARLKQKVGKIPTK